MTTLDYFDALTAVLDISHVFYLLFYPRRDPLRETEWRNENGVMGFLFFGRCVWRICVFGRGWWNNCILGARAGGIGGGLFVYTYLYYLYLVFVEMLELERLFIVQLWL